jgi:cyclic pyranopterin phosphate synthase
VRFIEFMPVENGQDWGLDFPEAQNRYISIKDIRGLLGNIQPVEDNKVAGSGPARIFRIAGAEGTIGFISPVSEHFCGECNRLRLTADGNLKPCLLHSSEIPLRDSLRQGQDISPLIEEAVRIKPLGHNLKDRLPETKRTMSQIGG